MTIDPNNKIAQLCAEGMAAETQGKIEEARQLFDQAWNCAGTDMEKYIAAHYVARNQPDPQQGLQWNIKSLDYAQRIKDESIRGHFSSLYLNVAKSYETLGKVSKARVNYELALQYSDYLPSGPYGDLIKSGIQAGLQRTGKNEHRIDVLEHLITEWCARRELRPLALILPAYTSHLDDGAGIQKLVSALSYLSATKYLPHDEQEKIYILTADLTLQKVQ